MFLVLLVEKLKVDITADGAFIISKKHHYIADTWLLTDMINNINCYKFSFLPSLVWECLAVLTYSKYA